MVLGKDASSLLYATFFGAYGLADHVDGGTSRFDKRGIIYEAVCAGCGGYSTFPTTPGAWSRANNSNNCNNAAFKFDLSNLRADFTIDKDTVCAGMGIVLTNKSLGGKSFFWDLGDGTTSTSYGPIRHIYKSPGTYEIMLVATDLTTCIAKDTVKKEVTILSLPDIVVQTSDTSMCYGDSLQLVATYNPYYNYLWQPSATLSNDTVANPYSFAREPSSYLLTVRDTNNCEIQKTVRLGVVEVLKDIEWEKEADCEGQLVVTFLNKTKNALFNWDFGDGQRQLHHKWGDVVHAYQQAGTYTVTLNIDGNGCIDTQTVTISIEDVFIPNLITPNGDGENDFYTIKGITKNWDLEIYNGWGDQVYKNSNYNNQWDGAGLSDGVYFFLITSPNENRCKGWVQIVR
jgi:gliding motility-associated-like protein